MWFELLMLALGAALFALAVHRGMVLSDSEDGRGPLYTASAPLLGSWEAHVGAGTPAAIAVAVLVLALGPRMAHRLPLPAAWGVTYLATVAWTVSLAMVDGWQRGIVDRLKIPGEYLTEVDGVTDVGAMLPNFTGRILLHQSDSWATHVSGHPPGALLSFVWLDRIGLGGGAAAGMACILIGSLAPVAVAVTLWALGAARQARTLLPFAALFPGAVWIGVSADGLFAGVTACGVAALALSARAFSHGAVRQQNRLRWAGVGAGLLGGLLLGFGLYLSYGLVLMAPIALVALLLGRRWQPLVWGAAGLAAVVIAFTLAGFWWFDGYELVQQRYYQGVADSRPYSYFVWANIAALLAMIGPATLAALPHLSVHMGRGALGKARSVSSPVLAWPVLGLAAAAVLVVAVADGSGLSKGEVERIWLPFGVWMLAAVTLLPGRRRLGWWLPAQAVVALLVNHLVFTGW